MLRASQIVSWFFLLALFVVVGVFGYTSLRDRLALQREASKPKTPPLVATDPARGAADPTVTILEFGDYQCQLCGVVAPRLEQLLAAYPDQVRLVWRDFPLTAQHPQALAAAKAARCAGEQGAYWPMHDLLFQQQQALSDALYTQSAETLHLRQSDFSACMDNPRSQALVEDSLASGVQYGVDGTPYFFVNDIRIGSAQSIDAVERTVRQLMR